MKIRSRLLAGLSIGAILLSAARSPAEDASKISWKKTQLDKTFRSEGVAIADVNKDGKMDIIAGDVWYEAPDWKMHEIRKPAKDYGDGAKGYSNSFLCFTDDFNRDGWPDVLIIGFPGAPCSWYENPKNEPGHWKAHPVWHSACNETPLFADLFGTGKRVLVMAWQKGKENTGQMAWFRPGADPTQTWEMHPISEPGAPGHAIAGTAQYSHGLGAGDLNGDGRADVICTGGWWEQPAKDDGKPWKFHEVKLGQPCANMIAYDVDGDGLADVISSSAHQFGIWWHQQRKSSAGESSFLEHTLFPRLVSQTHALHCVDINGDGLKDLVTGKRWWAHGPNGPDADQAGPAKLYWFEAKKGADGIIQFTPHEIDDDSGIGTQFAIGDINGDGFLDVAVSNKKGTCIVLQQRTGK